MDVSGWTIDQKARLPDWCFGKREAIGCQVYANAAATWFFGISTIDFPDPCCIWAFYSWFSMGADSDITYRVGLRDTVPVNTAEMDTADEIFPYVGEKIVGPNHIRISQRYGSIMGIETKQGMVTGAKNLVVALYTSSEWTRGDFVFIVSGLPTSMAGWLAHNPV